MEQNTFNPMQRHYLLSELEKLNESINIQIRVNRKEKDDSPKYKCVTKSMNDLMLHILEERKTMLENLLQANELVYISEYDHTTKTYANYIYKENLNIETDEQI